MLYVLAASKSLMSDNSSAQTSASASTGVAEPTPKLTFRKFLESTPPETVMTASDAVDVGEYSSVAATPAIQVHCEQPECGSVMWFDYASGRTTVEMSKWGKAILIYTCRHCKRAWKAFAIYIKRTPETTHILKIGEYPPFGPPTPARVITLIGPDRELFLKGRRSENHGLGIGAFAYYRRVVENQKNRIIEEIVRVAKKVGAKPEVIQTLEAALKETQFSSAVESIKAGIPESLLIDGHNPLRLLHSALSRGLHEEDDAKCLELAQSIRVVLTELADRIGTILKEEAELKAAVSKILQEKSKA